MTDELSWGIIGTGTIARTFARGLAGSETGTLLAVGSRSQNSADEFGQQSDVPRRYGSYDDLLADCDVQAVYISTPHPMHAEWAIKSADAGKHVLCEKPIGLNHAEAMAIFEAAHRNDVFCMEAFMYRCHPQTDKLVELIHDRVIGDVRVIQATFSFHCPFDPESRLYKNGLGGGGILDVGCYCTSMARLIAGAATGKDFAEPIELKATGHLAKTGIDEYTVASLKFPGDIIASLATGVAVNQESVVRVFGTEGDILVPNPWIPAVDGGEVRILVNRNGRSRGDEIVVTSDKHLYAIEADTVSRYVDQRQPAPPAMTRDDTLGNMKTLDRWREAIGLVYDAEKPEAQTQTVHRRPLARRDDHDMQYGTIPGIDRPVSRLIMGVDHPASMPYAAVLFDDYFERGGNAFDTAHIYGGGVAERLLGQWVKNRSIRDQVVIIDKGAHTPWCNPEDLTRQLNESLDRLQMDYLDIYLMHRDNPDVPVGEFVDVLNEHKRAGRIRAFGGSNWTIDRLEAANDYAGSKGVTGFVVSSNQLSLARMVEPPWPGCLSAGDPESRAWHERTQMPLLSWSSQARGFFSGNAHPDNRSDAELVRCWYCDDNFQRLQRAAELARKHDVEPINVALAYVLRQPFPTFPLVGPRTLAETRSSCESLDVELTPDELRWLNLED